MPRYLERFALRLLAKEVKGAESFDDYLTVDGEKCATFADAAKVNN